VTSLYLRLWPDSRIHQLNVKDLIREKLRNLAQEGVSKEKRQIVESDMEKLRKVVETFRETSYRGLVVFSCNAYKIFEVFPLAHPVRDILVVNRAVHIGPLIGILNQYKRVCTLLVDRTRARVFETFMGEIEEQSGIYTHVPPKVREAGWHGLSEKRIEGHINDHLRSHLKEVVEQTFIHFREKGFDWLFIGGQPEILTEMEGVLHSYLKQKLKRTFRMSLDSHPKEVLEKTLELGKEIKKEEDQVLVSRLANALKSAALGVSGIHETLSCLYKKNAHMIMVEEGFSEKGVYCSKCGFMGLKEGSCPICKKPITKVPNIVDEAVASAIDQRCEVSYITPGCGLEKLGRIGALLRYKENMGRA
jgi:peptide chain release factor subunit 1